MSNRSTTMVFFSLVELLQGRHADTTGRRHHAPVGTDQTWPGPTLLVKSRRPIFNALGVPVTGGTRWSLRLSNVVCKTAFPCVFDLTNRVRTSFTSVGSQADSPAPIRRPSPATGHEAEILDVDNPYLSYDAETFP
jgi:hypothetical protein